MANGSISSLLHFVAATIANCPTKRNSQFAKHKFNGKHTLHDDQRTREENKVDCSNLEAHSLKRPNNYAFRKQCQSCLKDDSLKKYSISEHAGKLELRSGK